MLRAKVVARAHLDEAADGAVELAGLGAFAVELAGLAFGGHDELDLVVVEDVDQPGEAARLGGLLARHARHAGEEHGVVAARDLEVVVLRARPHAQGGEVEPDDADGAALDRQLALEDVHRTVMALAA